MTYVHTPQNIVRHCRIIYLCAIHDLSHMCEFQQRCTFEQTLNHPTPSLGTYALQLESSSRTGNKTVFKPPSKSIQPSCLRFRSKHSKSYVCCLNCQSNKKLLTMFSRIWLRTNIVRDFKSYGIRDAPVTATKYCIEVIGSNLGYFDAEWVGNFNLFHFSFKLTI